MQNKKNIVLIGMMGAGKTSVGLLLKEKLFDFRLVDIDKEIENFTQKKISEIFSILGENYFREIEHQIIKTFSNKQNQIISTGGGIVEKIENINLLKKNSIIFFLNADVETIFDRIKNSTTRPLLKSKNPLEILKKLIEKRIEKYKLADFEIKTDNKTLEQITEEIIKIYETTNN